jgi:DNA-binding transcriptional LysR family regulator
VRGAIEANSGETLGQLALDGVGIARVGNFSLGDAIAEGRLVPLLEPFNPGDKEIFHAVFVGGANMPARVRVFVDYLTECMGGSRGLHQRVTAAI